MRDYITHIKTRKHLELSLERAKHPKLFLLDIKDFAQINLEHTDLAGNFVLASFARELEAFAKSEELECFSLGGDLFVLLADLPFDLGVIEKLLYSISNFLEHRSYVYEGETIDITLRMGISLERSRILEKARFALKVAKAENQLFCTYSDFARRLLEESEETLGKTIETAIDEGTITPYYQPIIDAKGDILYFEALIRLASDAANTSPMLFLDIAKSRGFYAQMMQQLCRKIDLSVETMGINLSFADLLDDAMFDFLLDFFGGTQSVFELHGVLPEERKELFTRMEKIQSAGIKICIEAIKESAEILIYDTGLINFVKIEPQIIRLLGLDTSQNALCAQIIATSKEHHIQTIATHINAVSTFELTKELGFDYYQGFFLAKPSPVPFFLHQ